MITDEQKELVQFKVSDEGLDYTFLHYSTFPEIKDHKFHQLREEYILAARELEKYIGIEY